MKENVVLINPPLVSCKGDFSGSGIPYMPILLASINHVIGGRHNVTVFDMYGDAPDDMVVDGCNIIHGKPLDSVKAYGGKDTVAVVYAGTALVLDSIIEIVSNLKSVGTKRIIVVENSQHVTALPLDIYSNKLIKAGADFIICGDPEYGIMDAIAGKSPVVCRYSMNGDDYPIPYWSGFPIGNYWRIPFAHVPRTNQKYMQLLTSRGCNGKCHFCTSPKLNDSRWRARSARSVFDEISYWYDNGIKEFHVEDLNPAIDKQRIKDLCQMILDSHMFIEIKVAAGLKIETINEETLLWMHDAGFTYMSFSPETGSNALLDLMNKKFDHEYAIRMLDFINSDRFINPIFTQACFIAGYPGETEDDFRQTERYVKRLAKAGLDEIAIFGFAPMPGSVAAGSTFMPSKRLTFGSGWRMNRHGVEYKRIRLAILFYICQMWYRPEKIFRFVRSKVWMTIKRVLYYRYKALWAKNKKQ